MIVQGKNENRAAYMMRVAAAYIMENCPDGEVDYDETTCDGNCAMDDLDNAREEQYGS